jgi:hypothetical protein
LSGTLDGWHLFFFSRAAKCSYVQVTKLLSVFPQNLLKTTQGLGKTQAKTALADSRAPSNKILVIPTACIDGIKTPIGARILLD